MFDNGCFHVERTPSRTSQLFGSSNNLSSISIVEQLQVEHPNSRRFFQQKREEIVKAQHEKIS
jgi:hypothetical protein